MSSSKRRSLRDWSIVVTAGVLLTLALKVPLWQMRMEAPQYRAEEALRVAVYPNELKGDLDEIQTLNQYIGVHVPDQLPQTRWLPIVLLSAATLSVAAGFLSDRKRRWALAVVPSLLAMALAGAAIQAQAQMYDIGHRRDQKTVMVGVKDFTPPLLGTTKIAQFQVTSTLGVGAYLAGIAILLQYAGAWGSLRSTTKTKLARNPEAACFEPPRPAAVPCPSFKN